MRRSALAALLLPGLVLLAGCRGQDTSRPVEPSFAKVADGCAKQTVLLDHLYAGIDALFGTRQAKKAAQDHIDNIYREVCQDPPDYDAAQQHLNSFVQQVAGQPEDKLAQDAQAWNELVNWAFVLAVVPFEIPAAAFASSGGLGVVDPSLGLASLITRDDSARVTILREDGAGPFIVAISRHDGVIEVLSDHDGGFGPNGAKVEVCVPTDDLDAWVADRLVIRHGSAVFLAPIESDICPPEISAMMQASTSGTNWIGRVASWAGNTARTLLGPEPVRAMYFAGRGLGGLTGSFSPFTVVDPYTISAIDGPDEVAVGQTVEMAVTVSWPPEAPDATPNEPPMGWTSEPASGGSVTFSEKTCAVDVGSDALVCTVSVIGETAGNAAITADYPGLQQVKKTITVVSPPTLTVTVSVETPGLLEIKDNHDHTCSANDKWAEPTVCSWTYEDATDLVLTAVVHRKIEGSWDIQVLGAWSDPLIEIEESHEFPSITWTGDKTITFTLLH